MKTISSTSAACQTLLAQALEEYYTSLESGQPISREQLLTKYGNVGEELMCCLDSIEFVNTIAPDLANRASSESPIATPLPERAQVGDFRIGRQIGRGGMGVVYEAEQLSLGRRVALKVLPFAAMLDDRQLQRFKNEARAAALLQHPHIVPVHGIGVERGVHYYAMQLIEGTTLAAIIEELRQAEPAPTTEASTRHGVDEVDPVETGPSGRNESPEPDETKPTATLSTEYHRDRHRFYRSVARVGQQAAEALHHAHQSGIVHRDIKPSNLLIDRNGTVWVADFGLAQFHSDHTLTASGDFLGTLRYMSPERLDERGVVDHRCDVYSLGITLYELTVGREAFSGESREQIVRRILNEPLLAPRKLDSRIPVDLETIIQKATSKAPETRYVTAAELAEDLQRYIESKPVRARRASRTELLRLWAGRNPLPAALAVVVVCLLLALAVGSTVFGLNAVQGARRESALLAETATRLYVSEIRRAQSLIEEGDILAGEQVLLRQVPQAGAPDHRGFEWFYLWEQYRRAAPQRLFLHGVPGYQVSYHPDGQRLITGSWGGMVNVWDRATGTRVLELTDDEHNGPIAGLGFIDGTELISVTRYGSIGRWDLRSETPSWLIQNTESLKTRHAAVSPKRKLVAASFASPNQSYVPGDVGHVVVWDLEARDTVARFDDIPGKPLVDFSADESRLFISGFDGRVRIVDTASWTQQQTLAAHEGPIWALALSKGVLATGGGRGGQTVVGSVKLWDTSTWQTLQTQQIHNDVVQSLKFSNDGSRFVSGSRDGTLALWRVEEDLGHTLISLFKAHSEGVNDIAFAPNDSEFSTVSNDRTCRVWNLSRIENQLGTSQWGQRREMKVGVALAENDTRVCVSSGFGAPVEVRDVHSGQLRYEIETNDATFNDVAVSPDGKLLAVAAGHFPLNKDSPPPGDFRLYDVNSGTEVRRFTTDRPFTCRGIGFSSDGRFLVAACWQHLVVWDVATGEQIDEVCPADRWFKAFRVHPSKPLVACGTVGGMTYIYELPSLRLLKHRQTENGTIESIDFSPDGKYFSTGGAEQQVKLWDAETFELVQPFSRSGNWVTHVRFSPDGRRILSGCMNGHLYLSDVTTGEHLLNLPVDPTWVFNGEFSRDASFIVAAGDRVHLWRCADRWRDLRRLPIESLPRICEK